MDGTGSKTGWWIAGVLAALMIGGAGTFYANLKSPSQAQVDRIEERQQIVLQRLAALDVRLANIEGQTADVQAELDALEAVLAQHADPSP